MTRTVRKSIYLATTVLGFATASPALAQAEPESADDIIVTARRVEERLQDVPISITVFNQAQLDNRNITTASELGNYTPSLSVNARFGPDKASFAIRGFSQIDTTSPTVGVYFADVIAPRTSSGTTAGNGVGPGSFFDLQNVQVLKGPQGTLFGRNTTGGAVLLVPQKPTDRLEGYVEGSLGNYGLKRVQAVLNIPLSDTFRVRAGIDRQVRDGYQNNISGVGPKDFGNSNYFAARLSVVGDLTPDLENYMIARYNRSETHGVLYHLVGCNRGPYSPGTRVAIYASAACAQIDREAGGSFYNVENIVPDPVNTSEEWQVVNTTTWKASDTVTVKNIASYGEFREKLDANIGGERLLIATGPNAGAVFPTTVVRNAPGQYATAQSTFTEELQVQGRTEDGKLNWQLGGYFERSTPLNSGNATYSETGITCLDSYTFQCAAVVPAGAAPNLQLTKNQFFFTNIGIYGQATYKLNDQLAITAGARYTIDRSSSEGERIAVGFPTANTPVGTCANPKLNSGVNTLILAQCSSGTFVQNSSKPTWLIDVEYKPTNDVMLYGKYSRGYRQGGINPSNIGLETWRPEKVDTYEVGAKTSFSGAVSGFFNIAGFYNNFTDQQLSATAIGCTVITCGYNGGIPGARLIVNAGKSRIWGVEVDASVTLLRGLKLDAGYAYLNTKLLEFTAPTLPVGGVFANVIPQVPGNDLPFSPHHRITLTGTYTLPLDESIGHVSVGVTYTHTTSQLANPDVPAVFGVLPPENLVNLSLNWGSVGGSAVDLSAFVTNLTKEEFPVQVAGNYSTYGFESVVTNLPRMWGFRLKYRFGN
jgi:iron complex outermembrane receptor protein